MATRFRTQDTKASWARKLNELFTSAYLAPPLKETPQTLQQWQRALNAASVAIRALGITPAIDTTFRLTETRQLWTRKLNALATALDGVARTLSISVIATDDAVTNAEAASVTISGTSAAVPNGTVLTILLDGRAIGTATVASNAWSKTGLVLTGVNLGAHRVTVVGPGVIPANRTITRTA